MSLELEPVGEHDARVTGGVRRGVSGGSSPLSRLSVTFPP